ncbi:hypothetical protein [Thaumasiovibrio subtropicus]|uniref:hypothetical protein n=1 Tax=Thaumasiovibrio subtropicus TaxID=1891207 RepID=UPI000B3518A3|nr:hypothetical protein [Thaumasiovibrio subtropicus]
MSDLSFLSSEPDAVLATTAFVYDKRFKNRRPMFSMALTIQRSAEGKVEAQRDWYGVGDTVIASETLVWSGTHGITHMGMHNPSLEERGALSHDNGKGEFQLVAPKTDMVKRVKQTQFPSSPASLTSLPLEVVKHWDALKRGEKLTFDYAVLKVQAHTQIEVSGRESGPEFIVKVTPKKWFWRFVFGSSYLHFNRDRPLLRKMVGLMEPRDLKPNGKYIEYLGEMAFEPAIDLTEVVK